VEATADRPALAWGPVGLLAVVIGAATALTGNGYHRDETLTLRLARKPGGRAGRPPGAAVVLTANYGEAGALDRFGAGLPGVYSGQNEFWYRGRPRQRRRHPNEEQDNDIRVCRDPVEPWSTLWPRLQHYS